MEVLRGRFRVRNLFKAFTQPVGVGGASILMFVIYALPPFLLGVLIAEMASIVMVREISVDDLFEPGFSSGWFFGLVQLLYWFLAGVYYSYFHARLILVLPLMLDRNYRVMAAFKTSFESTREPVSEMTLFHLVLEAAAGIVFGCMLPPLYLSRSIMDSAAALYMMGELEEEGGQAIPNKTAPVPPTADGGA